MSGYGAHSGMDGFRSFSGEFACLCKLLSALHLSQAIFLCSAEISGVHHQRTLNGKELSLELNECSRGMVVVKCVEIVARCIEEMQHIHDCRQRGREHRGTYS